MGGGAGGGPAAKKVRAGRGEFRGKRLACGGGCTGACGGNQAQGGIEALPAGGSGLEGFGGEVERFAVVGLQGEQAQGHRRHAGIQQAADGGEVAERFAHLLAAHIHHAVVQPVAG